VPACSANAPSKQVKRLDIDNTENCLRIFRANRETGALIALAFLAASWFG
jgi:4-hydroxybenzoate polyprenyltransferase